MTRIIALKYRCIKCNKTEYITVKNDSLNAKYQLVSKCFDNKICLDCYCASEKALHGTAEKIFSQQFYYYSVACLEDSKIALAPEYKNSKGTLIEIEIAKKMEIKI